VKLKTKEIVGIPKTAKNRVKRKSMRTFGTKKKWPSKTGDLLKQVKFK
jgi:hypothetical protein